MTNTSICICPDCDLVLEKPRLINDQTAFCPRCKAIVGQHKAFYADKTLAFSLAGLLLYYPACTMPVMTFSILGVASTNTMLNGVQQLFAAGYWWMSFLVLMCSVVVPLFNLVLLFVISFALKQRYPSKWLGRAMLWQQHIKEWGMLEVYMLGILVAYSKMMGMGDIVVDMGLLCFTGMLLCTLLAQVAFDTESGFDDWEENLKINKEASSYQQGVNA